MANKTINAIIQLRRDNETNFNLVKDTFIPANGEIVLVDTINGLRAKVGTGTMTYGRLPFTDVSARNSVVNGYYYNGVFYENIDRVRTLQASIGKIYVDNAHSKIYFYDGEQYVQVQNHLSLASSVEPGTVKLYNTLGYNEDGTMTQKAITDEFNTRYKTDVDIENELLIFSL